MTSLPTERGAVSAHVLRMLRGDRPGPVPEVAGDVLVDEDVQLALWCLFELHHRGFDDVDPDLEWDPEVIRVRRVLEAAHLAAVRDLTRERLEQVDARDDLVDQIDTLLAVDDGPSLAEHLRRHADADQFRDFLRQRSIYHLKESDPHAFVVPRLDGVPKVALAELQYDEFGAGRPAALHSSLFAEALAACGLDPTYGAYVDEARATTLAVNTTMSLFGVNRRWRGAAMGHLAAFESTSSLPCRWITAGARRLGLPEEVATYYEEHIEADAVHEQLAVRSICAPLVAAEPDLHDDVLLGVAACLELDALAAREQLAQWGRATAVGVPA
ncbi:iron-containing redox enzyme family protein [Janibacter cremeus]|uniref:iron-containing redox enzyme family protein n=1 Tax=Janibacter cremeus TaxID=1285192 RepID=UPI0023F6A033|nr:iron-containing redox enzyme family protein [Janibacter cremeus]WEV77067.1 iron-containing redox enzyme family protein [Janibacter cremeus]